MERAGTSLRATLIILFSISVALPSFLVMGVMPLVYNSMITRERGELTDVLVKLVNKYLDDYLDAMERETIIPYFSPEFAKALRDRREVSLRQDPLALKRSNDLLMRVMQNAMWVYRNDIVSSVLVSSDGKAFSVSRKWGASPVDSAYVAQDRSWYRAALEADGRAVFIPPHPQDYLENPTASSVFSVARLIRDPDTQSSLGVIMVDQNTAGIDRVLGDLDPGLDSILLIAEKGGGLLYATQPPPAEIAAALARSASLSGEMGSWLVVEVENERFGWRVAMLLSQKVLAQRAGMVFLIGVVFILGSLVLGFLAFTSLSKRITAPITSLIHAFSRMEGGDLTTRIEPAGVREARNLAEGFNAMARRIQYLIEQEYHAQLSMKEAKYQALQSQLQPHFLYNVLYGLQGLNQLGERSKLEEAIYDLHDMLRYSLEPGLWTTVQAELDFVEHYCLLQKLRFQERFAYNIVLDPAAADLRIPRLLLQPLVENAIIHGIEPLGRTGHLLVEARLIQQEDKKTLNLRVVDDGAGFDPGVVSHGEKENGAQGHGLGMSQAQERLGHHFPGAQFAIDSSPQGGTLVSLEIPL